MSFSLELKSQIARSIKKSPLSREEIVEGISKHVGHSVSCHQLNNWTSDSHGRHYFPAEYIPAFITIVRDQSVLELICQKANGKFVKIDQLNNELTKIESELMRLEARRLEITTLLNSAGA